MFRYIRELYADLITAFLAVVILKLYFETIFEKNKRNIFSFICWLIFFAWQVIIRKINCMPAYGNVVINVFLISMICLSTYKGNLGKKILFSALINALWMLFEFFVGYIFILNGKYDITLQFFGPLCSELLTLFLIICLRIFSQNENIKGMSNKKNFILLLIPLGSMFVVYNIFMLSAQIGDAQNIEKSLTSSVIIFLINVGIFKVYISLSKEKELQKYNIVYKQQIELCTQHMREKEAVMLSYRNARHDMKQHFTVLMEMLNNDEYELAVNYLKNQINMESLSDVGISRTNNIVIDSLINAKHSIALKEKIKFTLDIHIPMELPFEGADICILLGNILDNAIEASMKIPEEKRYINCFMKYESNALIITLVNAFDGKLLKKRDNKIISNKEDAESHGIGLESVRKVADKYHGSVVIDIKQETFMIKLTLCDLPKRLQGTP